MASRRVVIVVFPGVHSLDACGPLEVFTSATRWLEASGKPNSGYRSIVAARGGGPVRTSSGLGVLPDADIDTFRGPVDTLVVAGGEGTRAAARDVALLGRIRQLSERSRRIASVCTGAFILAEIGLLDGRRATTHWASCAALATRYQHVTVDPDPIYVRDGNVWTSAGVTAGIDLSLAMVEEDIGREPALAVARQLVLFLHRPGNQAQFSARLTAQLAQRDSLRTLQAWIGDNPAEDMHVDALAARVAMSPRHFARAWHEDVGVTPARYVERVRIEAARWRLEDSDDSVEEIAGACGFASTETMRRSFLRVLGSPPSEYRQRFRSAALISA